jgi:GNAT superfamily N-acetyltransferase
VTVPRLSAPQPLSDRHQLAAFDSGEPSLDDWLRRRAAKNQANGSSRTYVVCEGSEQARVVAYYCLSAGAIGHAEAPSSLKRNRPDPIPVFVLGRMAIHKDQQQQGIGTALLNDAIRRTIQAANIAGVTALLALAVHRRQGLTLAAARDPRELASARPPVDILVSFITHSGVRKLQDVLQQITALRDAPSGHGTRCAS